MRFELRFHGDSLDLELDDERVVAAWSGPADLPRDSALAALRDALTDPLDFPAMRLAMIPGDHVVFVLDPDAPLRAEVIESLILAATESGVTREDMTVVSEAMAPTPRFEGPVWVRHDAESAQEHAYLATTREGHRVYLSRPVVDADVVVPVGWLGHDERLGHLGPWSVLYPSLSDTPTRKAFRDRGGQPEAALAESAEVSWLLGAAFQIGILPGASGGIAKIIAGEAEAVRKAAQKAIEDHWTLRVGQRADLVVAGVGGPDQATTLHDVARGVRTGMGLVRRGGRIAIVSHAAGFIGPAMDCLAQAEEPASHGLRALKGSRDAPDFEDAVALAKGLAWADVYLFSDLPESDVEDLGMVALGRAEEVRRLIKMADSVIVMNRAELTRAEAAE
jgi:hypothetical protein